MQSDSPLTVAGPCWVCHAALRGATHQLPLHPGVLNSTRDIPFLCRLLSPPFRPHVHPYRRKAPAYISSTTKNPNPLRRIGVLIPKPRGEPAPRSTRTATRPPSPSEGHQHLGAGQVSWLAAYLTLCAFPVNYRVEGKHPKLWSFTSGVQQISTPLTVAGQQRPSPPRSGCRASPFSLFPPSADPAPS